MAVLLISKRLFALVILNRALLFNDVALLMVKLDELMRLKIPVKLLALVRLAILILLLFNAQVPAPVNVLANTVPGKLLKDKVAPLAILIAPFPNAPLTPVCNVPAEIVHAEVVVLLPFSVQILVPVFCNAVKLLN
ncbi:hypothetical protein SRDD_38320 [Serratia sp. DD3]|nr:hypothetical protein SRDD_38320 [Serratia sp. DD3]